MADALSRGGPPHHIEELAPGEHPPRVGRQSPQQLELGGGELDSGAVSLHAAMGKVDQQVLGPDRLRRRFAGGPAQHRLDPSHQLSGAERFDHIVVGSELETDDPIGLLAAGGEHDDGDRRVTSDGAGDVVTVHAGQTEVEHHQVRLIRAGGGEGGGTGAGQHHVEARLGQVVPDQAGDLQLVIDDEDLGHGLIVAVAAGLGVLTRFGLGGLFTVSLLMPFGETLLHWRGVTLVPVLTPIWAGPPVPSSEEEAGDQTDDQEQEEELEEQAEPPESSEAPMAGVVAGARGVDHHLGPGLDQALVVADLVDAERGGTEGSEHQDRH